MSTYTPASYTANGTQKLYSFAFPYLRESDVVVTVGGVVASNYTFPNTGQIEFDTAPTAGNPILIERVTDADSLIAVLQPGSSLPVDGLNDNFNQSLYVAQEATTTASEAAESAADAAASAEVITAIVADLLDLTVIANVAATPGTGTLDDVIQVTNSTGIESDARYISIPGGFVGSSQLSVRARWNGTKWAYLSYSANDPDARYLKTSTAATPTAAEYGTLTLIY
jgi:hypothetical protein